MKIRVMLRDEKLPHQIIITTGRNVNESAVSCNCKRLPHGGYMAIGYAENKEGTVNVLLNMYRLPENHRNDIIPFSNDVDWSERITVDVQ